MYHRILVPTDGSEGAEVAFDHAVRLATETDAELHVVNAVDPTLVPVEVGTDVVFDALRATGEDLLGGLRERGEARGVTVETAVLTGTPHEAISDYAEEAGVDLLVMGTHGRSGLNRWLLGSVTEKVVRTAPVPVLTVRAAAD